MHIIKKNKSLKKQELFKEKYQQKAKPFLRWAGGKNWLVKQIDYFLPKEGFRQYHEPFLGGAAIFFHIKPKVAFLSDTNNELIETYSTLKNNVYRVIRELEQLKNTEEEYYLI